jgi:type IV secretion system protein VirB1
MQTVLSECLGRTDRDTPAQTALREALSCYYSGNFVTGFRHGYVRRVARAASTPVAPPSPATAMKDRP